MKDGDYEQLWQQMTNKPVSDRLGLDVVKSQFFETVDWDIFTTEWLALFSDANDPRKQTKEKPIRGNKGK
eukprot:7087747-Prymnesium_polylepis.1